MTLAVLALDLSTNVGWACSLPGAPPKFGTIKTPGQGEVGAAMAALLDHMADTCRVFAPDRIVMEAPLPAQAQTNARTARLQIGLAGAVELFAYRWAIPVQEAPASTVRAEMLRGARPAKGGMKPAVIAWCRAQGWQPGDDNAADALMLLAYAHRHPIVARAA